MSDLIDALLKGSRRATARLLTIVENEQPGSDKILTRLFPHTGHAQILGITGAPGTGKSSLVNVMAKAYRRKDKTVAIIAVDPTSPFSGGAILGDRIRMRDLSGDPGIFIRSMATRGSLGGLARASRDVVRVLDAAGFDVILVETVGAGQSEVDIVRTAQTTIVVEAPGLGDDVQAIKAGILEIADILVVNKSDRAGYQNTERALKTMLELGHPGARSQMLDHHEGATSTEQKSDTISTFWIPPVIRTVATEATGIDELLQKIEEHQQYIHSDDLFKQLEQQRIRIELYDRLQTTMMASLLKQVSYDEIKDWVERIYQRELDPQQVTQLILETHEFV